jgi:hypothetical protein
LFLGGQDGRFGYRDHCCFRYPGRNGKKDLILATSILVIQGEVMRHFFSQKARWGCLLVAAMFFAHCAGYPPRKDLKKIRAGMSRARLKDVLGEPDHTGRRGEYYYMKYYLVNKKSVGTAFYFLFDRDLRLVKWEEDFSDEVVDKQDVITHLLSPI